MNPETLLPNILQFALIYGLCFAVFIFDPIHIEKAEYRPISVPSIARDIPMKNMGDSILFHLPRRNEKQIQ